MTAKVTYSFTVNPHVINEFESYQTKFVYKIPVLERSDKYHFKILKMAQKMFEASNIVEKHEFLSDMKISIEYLEN